jgi:hypothetical protein
MRLLTQVSCVLFLVFSLELQEVSQHASSLSDPEERQLLLANVLEEISGRCAAAAAAATASTAATTTALAGSLLANSSRSKGVIAAACACIVFYMFRLPLRLT